MSPVSPVSLHLARSLAALCILGGSLVLVASKATADDEERFDRPGTIGLAFVYASDDFDHVAGQSGGTDDAVGGTFWLNYRFNQWIASQARGDYVRGFQLGFDGDDATTQYAQGSLGIRVFPLAPLTEGFDDRVEPFVDLTGGVGHADRYLGGSLDQKEIGFAARFAAGADVWLTDSIGLEFSAFYNLGTGEIVDFSYYGGTTGVSYRF